MAILFGEKLSLAWTGDYQALKDFVSDDLQLEGVWSQPGGDKKLFTGDEATIIWRRNKNLLSIDGKRANDILGKLCEIICGQDENSSETPVSRRSSVQSSCTCEGIETLKQGQLINGEAIQALSGSVAQLASMITQLRDFTNWKETNHCSSASKAPSFEANKYANLNSCNTKDTCPSVPNEPTNLVNNNEVSNDLHDCTTENLNVILTVDSVPENDLTVEQTKREENLNTYAKVVSSNCTRNYPV